jgi:hypothetical protein
MDKGMAVGKMIFRGSLLLTSSTSLFFGIMSFVAVFGNGMFRDGIDPAADRPWWLGVLEGTLLVGVGIFLGVVYRNLTKRWNPESPETTEQK